MRTIRFVLTAAVLSVVMLGASFGRAADVVDAEKVKALIADLSNPAKRKDAIFAIAAAGVAGRAAEPDLIKLLRDPDREVRLLAAYALEKLEAGK
jgi:hypothetical protein